MTKLEKPGRWFRFRSAITGRFVRLAQALRHPRTTVREKAGPKK
jgi:hypothetical protein